MLLEQEGGKLHASHLYEYISAFVNHPENIKDFIDDINHALVEADTTGKVVVLDNLAGECCLHVSPTGYISLMLPWKVFQVVKD